MIKKRFRTIFLSLEKQTSKVTTVRRRIFVDQRRQKLALTQCTAFFLRARVNLVEISLPWSFPLNRLSWSLIGRTLSLLPRLKRIRTYTILVQQVAPLMAYLCTGSILCTPEIVFENPKTTISKSFTVTHLLIKKGVEKKQISLPHSTSILYQKVMRVPWFG